ncbi:hypothetical protein [Candidatus Tisiphia endosymbiont of Dascillus cervinus]|uniref:hypothetical protein n=1 Tax=Candidatus Tisiphia endosymbiont of Dascillus cervinus TaxID=3066253 RepID=UPI00312C7574
MLAIGGGGVINDAYKRLEIFKELELNNRLEYAKTNPSTYDSMLQIDLRQFANSQEFKDYIHNAYEIDVDRNEAMLIGLLFALIAELSHVCFLVYSRLKNLVYKAFVRNGINKDM